MSADTQLDFLHYLKCDLPLGYPLKTPITRLLDTSLSLSSRRELLHQQDRFLDFSRQYLAAQPWLTYLAAIKHEAVLVTIPTYASQMVDIVDQYFFSDLQNKYKELLEASRAVIDENTALTCERLILLQSEAPQIEDAFNSVKAAIEAGFNAVEPLPLPPPEPVPAQKTLPYFVWAGVGCLVAGAIIPSYYGGMAWALLGLIIDVVVAFRVIGKEKSRVNAEGARFKSYMIHESYHALCRKSISLVLALPFEVRKSALTNLAPCLAALHTLQPEREAMEAAYITPFLGK